MNYKLQITKGKLHEIGVHKLMNGLSIVSDIKCRNTCGILIYVSENASKRKKEYKIPFVSDYLIGGLYCVFLPDFPFDSFEYIFYCDDQKIMDPYAKLIDASDKFGDPDRNKKVVRCKYYSDEFDWEGDRCPQTPFYNSIIYKIHMRGFTKHASSGVEKRGTFGGLKDKIPYLKDLGITAVETMPIFEFNDVIYNESYSKIDSSLLPFLDSTDTGWKYKTNYWGYAEGNYFAPKRAFSSSGRPDVELKELIKELHKNGIEIILDFYFEPGISQVFILDVCRFWMREYHVDGFKLMGCNLPIQLLIRDPYLQCTKLIFESLDGVQLANASYHNVAVMSKGFLYDIRKYLKGDEDMLLSVTGHFRENPKDCAILNEIASYQGFTLADLVSYDRKHNELNGEDNRDGSDYNYSWNCGAEGKTRKKTILALREQQSKNALLMLFTSQGTPILLAGDEFGNSADGNNNPYCQDNAISWLNWKLNATGKELLCYTKELIKFRKKHPMLHKEDALTQSDYISAGYPDISYHSDQAWYARFENYNRHIGIMYCGKYAKIDRKKDDDFIYVAYNTHWIEHEFALPKLPDDLKWTMQISTCPENRVKLKEQELPGKGNIVLLPPRTMVILTSIKAEEDMNESINASKDSVLS